MMLSVKVLSSGAISIGVIVAVSISLAVSLVSSDNALDTTRSQAKLHLDECFTEGEHDIEEVTNLLLGSKGETAVESVERFLDTIRRSRSAILESMKTQTHDGYHLAPMMDDSRVYLSTWESAHISEMTVTFFDGTGIMYYEKNISSITNVANTSVLMAYDPDLHLFEYGTPTARGKFYNNLPCNPHVWEDETAISGLCTFASEDGFKNVPVINSFDTSDPHAHLPQWSEVMAMEREPNVVLRSTFSSIDTSVSLELTPTGVVTIGFSTFAINEVLALHVNDHERAFIVNSHGQLVGVSHGNGTTEVEAINPITGKLGPGIAALQADHADDEVIRGVSSHITEHNNHHGIHHQVDESAGHHDHNETAENTVEQSYQSFYETAIATKVAPQIRIGIVSYFAKVTKIPSTGWWVVTVEEADVVVGHIHEERKRASAASAMETKNIEDDVEEDRAIVVSLVVIVVFVLIIIAVVAATFFGRSIQSLCTDMDRVAKLRLECVDATRHHSWISEIDSMHKSFRIMVEAMHEYRQYMPQVFQHDTTGRGDEEDAVSLDSEEDYVPQLSNSQNSPSGTPVVNGAIQSDGSKSNQGARRTPLGNHTLDIPTSHSGSGVSTAEITLPGTHATKKRNAGGLMAIHLTKRQRSSHMKMGCHDFSAFIRTINDSGIICDIHSSWIHACVTDVNEYSGIVVGFTADLVDINFGGLSHCLSSAPKAARFYMKVRDRHLQIRNEVAKHYPSVTQNLMPAVGLGTSSVFVGNLGTAGMKSPAVLGKAVDSSKVMHTISRELSLDLIVDNTTAEELRGVVAHYPVDYIKGEGGRKQTVYYAAEANHAAVGEWMYALDSGAQENDAYNQAWLTLTSDSLDEALEMFERIEHEAAAAVVDRVRSCMTEVRAMTGSAPTEYARVFRNSCTLPTQMVATHDALARQASKSTGGKIRSRVDSLSSRNSGKTIARVSSSPSSRAPSSFCAMSPPQNRCIENP
eukprot:TRINITY_DN5_c4_g1_i1.p1 TRINITY_DN5_c4_g1~~TRINITY_DN5_c4_g1_i1.p1  ORF type:complete len:979 (+),score=211.90 TRINITY_DN5_c4_g1_i1:89-3025(+)